MSSSTAPASSPSSITSSATPTSSEPAVVQPPHKSNVAGIVGGIVGAIVLIFAVGIILVRRVVHRNIRNLRDADHNLPAENQEPDRFASTIAGQTAINASSMASSPF